MLLETLLKTSYFNSLLFLFNIKTTPIGNFIQKVGWCNFISSQQSLLLYFTINKKNPFWKKVD